jgi:hypothetical protein
MEDTLQKAKNDLRQGWKTSKGATCECCGQKVKLYKRKILGVMAFGLISLYRMSKHEHPRKSFHRNDILPHDNSGSFAKLKYWGLIEEDINSDPEKRCSGYWSITDLGIDFVEERAVVPKYAYTYNMKVVFDLYDDPEEKIGIREALGNKFSYPELMGFLI